METKAIKLHNETIERIDQFKHRGQTFDGFINEMIDKLYDRKRDHKGKYTRS